MSAVLEKIRENYPQYKDVSDDDLTLRIGSKYPIYLEQDPGFKEDFQKAASSKSVNLALKGTGDVLKILTNPAAGEASAMGREQAQTQRVETGVNLATQATGKVLDMIQKGAAAAPSPEELAAQKKQAEFSKLNPSQQLAQARHAGAPLAGEAVKQTWAILNKGLLPFTKMAEEDISEAARQFTAAQLGVDPNTLARKPTKGDVTAAIKRSPAFASLVGAGKSIEGIDEFFTSPLGIATLGMGYLPATAQRLIALGFAGQMASQTPELARQLGTEMGKPKNERDYEKIAEVVTSSIANTGFTVLGALHGLEPFTAKSRADAALHDATQKAERVAPATAAALDKQVEVSKAQETTAEVAKTAQETPGGAAATETPPAGETPAGEPSPEAQRRLQSKVAKTLRKPFEQGKADAEKGVVENPYVEGSAEATAWNAGQKSFKEKGTPDAGTKIQEPEAGALPAEQGKPVEQPATGKAEEGVALRGGEDKGQKALSPKETIDRVVGGDQQVFRETVGKTPEEHAKKLGASLTDPKDLEALYDARKSLKQQFKNLETQIANAKEAKNPDLQMRLMQDRMDVAFKQQWVDEAIEGATGHPDAGKMEKLRKILGEDFKPKFPPRKPSIEDFKGKDGIHKFAEAHDAWEKQVADWVKNQPENKALIFTTEHNTYAVTKDPKGGWRYTSFSNKDHMPSMHEEFKTREDAVAELLKYNSDARHIDKMPFQIEPLPIRAFPGDEVTWNKPGAAPQVVKFRGYSQEPGKAFIEDPATGKDLTIDSMELGPKPKPAAEAIQKDIEEKKNLAPEKPEFQPIQSGDAPIVPFSESGKAVNPSGVQNRTDFPTREAAQAFAARERAAAKARGEDLVTDVREQMDYSKKTPKGRGVYDVVTWYVEPKPEAVKAPKAAKAPKAPEAPEPAKPVEKSIHDKLKDRNSEERVAAEVMLNVNNAMDRGETTFDGHPIDGARENAIDGLKEAGFTQKEINSLMSKSGSIEDLVKFYAPIEPEAAAPAKPAKSPNDLAAEGVDLSRKKKLTAKERSNLAQLTEEARKTGDTAALQAEIDRIKAEAPDITTRTANAIRADIRKTEKLVKDLKAAKRGYEKAGTKGQAASVQEKIRKAQNKLTDLQKELDAAEPQADKRVEQAMRRFNRETKTGGPDILSHINETGKLMSWSKFVEKAKTRGQEWFNQNKWMYDDIRNVKLPPHINAAIYGGENLPDTVADTAARDNKLSDGTPSALWKEVKEATNKRLGKSKGDTAEAKLLDRQEREQMWDEATGPREGRIEVDPSIVGPGERYMIDGQEVKVTDRNMDTGLITIDGGEKFGEIKLRDNEPFWVDSVIEAPEGEAEFLPHEEEEPKAPEKPTTVEGVSAGEAPKLRTGEKSGELFQGEDQPFNLAGEKGTDADRLAAEKAAAEKTAKEAAELEKKQQQELPGTTQKYRIRTNPTLYTMLERLPQSEAEKANNEQPVRVRNEKTGKEEIVMEADLTPVKEKTAEEKEKGKASKRDLDSELRALGLDPTVFKTKSEKQAAIIRENQKKQGPGSPHITQPPDPKANIEQLEESFRNVRGRRVPLSERVRAMFDLGKKLAAAKDMVTEAVAGLKTVGDYLVEKWQGYNTLDELLKAKGELSAEIEKNGWRMKQFVKTIEQAVPDPMQRAAIAKWVGAGGDMEKLIAGYEEAPDRFKQHYLDAMDLNGDLLIGAMNIRNFFEARLQEAIDAGVLQDGVEDYIHRIYEKNPQLEKKMLAYLQSGLLKTNPSLAKKRIFDHDWEAERLGYNVVQDFLPRITEYEAALTRAIAARKFVRKVVGYKDLNGNKVPGMLSADGRPIVDIAGLGIPVDDAEGIREASLIDPSYKAKAKQTTTIDPDTGLPITEEDPLSNRQDYQSRNQYNVFRNWKWVLNDAEGNPIYAKGDLIIHPDEVRRFDKLLEPSRIRYAQSPTLRLLGRGALATGSFFKQSMLDLSGFHQVQMAVHGAEHRVYTLPGEVPAGLKQLGFQKVLQDIDLNDPKVDGLLKGGMTLGGDYRYSREGLVGKSITRLIPGVSEVMESYHQYLFQDFIPRVKTTMALEALDRNMQTHAADLANGRMSMDELYAKTASQANAAFGELNQITLERSKTMQDALRLIFLAPDFLEARGRFALQAFQRGGGDPKTFEYWKKGGPITNNEQRMALAYGALAMWGLARVGNVLLDGQMHNEPENLFSVVYKGRAYGLRTVQGDILHLLTRPVQFWMSRLNPVFGRTFLEMATGRDYFGRKRSPLEQVWDLVSTLEPASIRHTQEHTVWESMANAMGVTSRRFSDVDDAFKLAQQWKYKHGVGMKGEFIYDPSKDTLRQLKVSLSNADEGASVKAIDDLLKKKETTLQKLDSYFDRYATMPFAGSQANDKKFIQGLSDDQKKTVQAAAQHKKDMRKLYLQAKRKYLDAKNGPAPKVDDSEIDQPTPQVQ